MELAIASLASGNRKYGFFPLEICAVATSTEVLKKIIITGLPSSYLSSKLMWVEVLKVAGNSW